MNRIRAICFDLDATLLDGSGLPESIDRTCAEIAARHPPLDAARLMEANRDVWQRYWPEVEDRWTLGHLEGASVSREAWRRTLAACGCGDESVVLFASQTHSRLVRYAHRLFGDVAELLASLKTARVPLALVTNGASDTQRDKLSVLGIEDYFDAVVISGEVGVAKPDAAPFRLAVERLAVGRPPVGREGVWHVGDSLANDVAGANAAGLTSVWLNRSGRIRGEGDPEPDLEIRSLSDLWTTVARSCETRSSFIAPA